MLRRISLLLLLFHAVLSQNNNLIKLYYNEKDCYQCNQFIHFFNFINTSDTDFHLYIKEDLKEFTHELLPLNKNISEKIKIHPVSSVFFTKNKCKKNCTIPSCVVFKSLNLYDSIPLKDLGRYKNLKYFIQYEPQKTVPNSGNQPPIPINHNEIKINFSDSIKISEITHYFYYNGHLSVTDGLLNKMHVFNFNYLNKIISYKWYNFNYFPDHHFKKCNCFDTLMHNTSKMKSGNFYHPMYKKQLFHSFLNDTGFFVMLKFPYFSAETRNDTSFLTVESKAFIYGRGYRAKKGYFICLKEDGIINKMKESFIQDFYYPFHIDSNGIHTKVYNEKNLFDNRFMAVYKIHDSCISSFHSLINFENKIVDKLNKLTDIMRNNTQFYYFINEFVFWDYKKNQLYRIHPKKLKHSKNSKLFIHDCMMKNDLLYVIYTDDSNKYNLIYDVSKNKILKNNILKNSAHNHHENILIFCPELNKILILNRQGFEFTEIYTIFE